MPKTNTDYLTTLSALQGETTAVTTSARTLFVQDTVREIYEAYPWPFNEAIATISLAGGVAALATDLARYHPVDVRYKPSAGEDEIYKEIDYRDQDLYNQRDHVFWLVNTDGQYALHTLGEDTDLVVKYQKIVPVVANASTGIPFEDDMTVALGARRFIKISENPDADIAQDEELFQQRLQRNIAAFQVNQPNRRRRTFAETRGHFTGKT